MKKVYNTIFHYFSSGRGVTRITLLRHWPHPNQQEIDPRCSLALLEPCRRRSQTNSVRLVIRAPNSAEFNRSQQEKRRGGVVVYTVYKADGARRDDASLG